jgi:hypothetical protein
VYNAGRANETDIPIPAISQDAAVVFIRGLSSNAARPDYVHLPSTRPQPDAYGTKTFAPYATAVLHAYDAAMLDDSYIRMNRIPRGKISPVFNSHRCQRARPIWGVKNEGDVYGLLNIEKAH